MKKKKKSKNCCIWHIKISKRQPALSVPCSSLNGLYALTQWVLIVVPEGSQLPLYRWGNWTSARLWTLSKVTNLMNGGVGVWITAVCLNTATDGLRQCLSVCRTDKWFILRIHKEFLGFPGGTHGQESATVRPEIYQFNLGLRKSILLDAQSGSVNWNQDCIYSPTRSSYFYVHISEKPSGRYTKLYI